MKKLIGIFAMLMITLSILGQSSGVYDMISKQPEYLNVLTFTHAKLNAYLDGESTSPKNFEELFSFIANDRFYVVSYDTSSIYYGAVSKNSVKTRDVWLFSWDGKSWNKAINTPLQTDSVWSNDKGWFHCIYYPLHNDEYFGNHGSVMVDDDGFVNISFLTHFINRETNTRSTFYRRQFILRPLNDGKYSIIARTNQQLM